MTKTSMVLVHGAWQGAWAWAPVRERLQAAGVAVFTPTLTGVGARAHLSAPTPGLETHVTDVASLIESEELENVVLVGHSYAGMVITGVADRLKTRIRHLVYLDAAVPADGDDFASAIPGLSAEVIERRRAAFRSLSPDGVWLPVPPPAMVGVTDPLLADWMSRRSTPHPLRTWLDPLKFNDGGHAGLPKTYVLATNPASDMMGYPAHAAVARQGGEWACHEIAVGHQLAALAPDEITELLLAVC